MNNNFSQLHFNRPESRRYCSSTHYYPACGWYPACLSPPCHHTNSIRFLLRNTNARLGLIKEEPQQDGHALVGRGHPIYYSAN